MSLLDDKPDQYVGGAGERLPTRVGRPFVGYELYRLGTITCFTLAILFFLAAFAPPALDVPPPDAPGYALPDWYLIWTLGTIKIVQGGLFPTIKLFQNTPLELTIDAKVMGVLLQAIIFLVLLVLPFVDRRHEARPVTQPGQAGAGVAMIVLMVMLTIYGIRELIPPLVHQELGAFLNRSLTLSEVSDWLGLLTIGLPVVGFVMTYQGLRSMQHGYEWMLNMCYQCGKCEEVCPTVHFWKNTTLNIIHHTHKDVLDDIYNCIACDACTAVCPQEVQYVDWVLRKRREVEARARAAQEAS